MYVYTYRANRIAGQQLVFLVYFSEHMAVNTLLSVARMVFEPDFKPYLGGRGVALALGLYNLFFHFFGFCKNQSSIFIPPPICSTHTTAILLRDLCAIYDLPPTLPLYAIHHTILPPPDPPVICHTPYNIGNDNVV